MQITLLTVGKTSDHNLATLISEYVARLQHYINFNVEEIPENKKTKRASEEIQKEIEGKSIIQRLKPNDSIVLLDEKGKEIGSVEFSKFIQKQMNMSTKRLVFIIGGPYGFSQEIYTLANKKLSLSRLTFSHQMVRLFFVEQLYRAFTILRNEPYHHH